MATLWFSLGRRSLYTPQMVVGGRLDVVGSQRRRVMEAIELRRSHSGPGPAIAIANGKLILPAADEGACTLWLIGFDRAQDVAIERGENRGRRLRYHNVVRTIERLGRWTGAASTFDLPLARHPADGRGGLAILVQRDGDRGS